MTRAELETLLAEKIKSGNSDTTAADLRAFEIDAINSNVNKEDDANSEGGYLQINNGRVDVTKINSETPVTGMFLSDLGLWRPVTWDLITGSISYSPDLNAALAAKLSSSLSAGKIFIGSVGGLAIARTISGDATLSNLGVLTLTSSSIINASAFKPLFNSYATVGNSGTLETDLETDLISANQIVNAGDKIEADYAGSFVSSGTATRQIKIYFAGTVIFDSGALTLSLSSAWTASVKIICASIVGGNTRYMVSFFTEGAALASYTSVGVFTSVDYGSANIIKITGTAAGVGAANNDITIKMAIINYLKTA